MSLFLDKLLKVSGNDYAAKVSEGIEAGDVTKYIDTGSYILNALVSGSIYKGLPANKIVMFAGEESTYKTHAVLGIVKNFLDSDPEAGVAYFESESALTKDMFIGRKIDVERVALFPVSTVQEFRTQALKILNEYLEIPEEERKPLMMVLDSLGMLSTTKEVEDTSTGSETKDMTKAAVIKATFRVLTLKLGRANVPLLMTNHTYMTMGMFATKEAGGGLGAKFASSYMLFLSKSKEKDGTDVIGNIIHFKNEKSRLTIENKKADVLVTYAGGLNRYYGLLELAEKYNLVSHIGSKYEFKDGTKAFEKAIYKDPESYFTKELLDQLDEAAGREFLYGSDYKMKVPLTAEEAIISSRKKKNA